MNVLLASKSQKKKNKQEKMKMKLYDQKFTLKDFLKKCHGRKEVHFRDMSRGLAFEVNKKGKMNLVCSNNFLKKNIFQVFKDGDNIVVERWKM